MLALEKPKGQAGAITMIKKNASSNVEIAAALNIWSFFLLLEMLEMDVDALGSGLKQMF